MKRLFLFFLLSAFLISCASSAPTIAPQLVSVYATPAAQPWLSDLYACAEKLNTAISLSSEAPDISLRVGEPETLASPAYQIDEEEILVVVNRESPIQTLTMDEAQALFAGQGDPSAQVWVYASGTDLQMAFDQLVMKGRGVTSFARLAVNPQEMSDVLDVDPGAVGVLPRHWLTDGSRVVFSAGSVPILALTKTEPQGVIKDLLGCLHSN